MSLAPSMLERAPAAPPHRAAQTGAGSILPLRLDGLCFDAGGKRLIDSISLELGAGTRSVILGPNGAGKSLLLRLCHGLIPPSAGRVVWSTNKMDAIAQRQAMVFQRPVLLRRSAAANVAYPLRLRGVPARERETRVAEALERAGLSAQAKQAARSLSGGEQQRLAIARAWVMRPEVLFLDEPTANLDPAAARAIELLLDSVRDSGTKIVLTTHNLGLARRVADEILFMHRGQVRERAECARFFTHPETAEAKAFLTGDLTW
jgi:tungstate transport system ATP-binding protein